jgi:iron complex outermembrane receptor protein
VTYQFNVKNLFDKVYYTSTTGSALAVAMGDGRRISLSATVKF